jgi:hypothetical protein
MLSLLTRYNGRSGVPTFDAGRVPPTMARRTWSWLKDVRAAACTMDKYSGATWLLARSSRSCRALRRE